MIKFFYKAKKGLDQVLEGTIEAQNKDEALNKLIEQGLFVITIQERTVTKTESPGFKKPRWQRRRITSGDILNLIQKLTILTRAKVELLSSLRIIYEQTDNLGLKEVVLELYNSIKEGKSFSDSLEKFPAVFSPLFVAIIGAGEASGRLDSALEQINEFSSRQENLKNKVSVALAYPTLLVLIGLVSIFVIINFVIPRLKPIFESINTPLPLITRVILKLSVFSNKIVFLFLLLLVSIICYILYHPKGKSFLNRIITYLKRNLPVIKRLIQNQELANFSRGLSLLLRSGVPALKSLDIAIPSLVSPKLREELKKVSSEVASGQTLSKSMENFTSLPGLFTKMVAVGEESGRLAEVLEEISHSYIQSVEKDIAIITSLIEPLLILVLGGILGGIVLSILLPTFQITQMVR